MDDNKVLTDNKENNVLEFLENLLNDDKRDSKGIEFFMSEGNILPNGDMTSFLYGAKKFNDFLLNRLTEFKNTKGK